MQKELNKKLIIGIGAGVIALIAAIVVIVIVANYKPTVEINKYVSVTFSGYDTVGEAEVVFDKEAFLKDYKGKIKNVTDIPGEVSLANKLEGKLDKTQSLTNGEIITYQWSFPVSTIEDIFECIVEYSDIEFTVVGLTPLQEVDLFEGISVRYDGIAPYGSAIVLKNSPLSFAWEMSYWAEPADRLSNGDTIKVLAGYGDMLNNAKLAYDHGVKPQAEKKEFVVEGIPFYVMDMSKITEDMLADLKEQAEVLHIKHVNEKWHKDASLTGFEYLGFYLLTNKTNDRSPKTANQIVLVYKVDAHMEGQFEKITYQDDTSYYTCVTFSNGYIDIDGTFKISDGTLATKQSLTATVQSEKHSWLTRYYTFYGYATLDSLFNKVIKANADKYAYETNITMN